MRQIAENDFARLLGKCTAIKKRRPVQVQFARQPGTLHTLEGPVPYVAGDALLQGPRQEMWPVQADYFFTVYQPAGGQPMGQPGSYCKQPVAVQAARMAELFCVETANNAVLHGNAGDWLVRYGPQNFGVVSAEIFAETYDVVE